MNWGMISYEIPLAALPRRPTTGSPCGAVGPRGPGPPLRAVPQRRLHRRPSSTARLRDGYAAAGLQARHGQELPAVQGPRTTSPSTWSATSSRPSRRPTAHRAPYEAGRAPVSAETPGLVCAHHHLYSALARGMPAPPATPHDFGEILEQIWWRLDTALDLDMLRASARLGAVEALLAGTTGIVDHHESPHAIEGSLDVIADGLRRGRRARRVRLRRHRPPRRRRRAPRARRERALPARRRARAWSACTPRSRAPTTRSPRPPGWPRDLGVGVHIHVAEGPQDADGGRAARRASPPTTGCSCTASASTATCPARSPTTRAAT